MVTGLSRDSHRDSTGLSHMIRGLSRDSHRVTTGFPGGYRNTSVGLSEGNHNISVGLSNKLNYIEKIIVPHIDEFIALVHVELLQQQILPIASQYNTIEFVMDVSTLRSLFTTPRL